MVYQTHTNINGQQQITWEDNNGLRSWALAVNENPHYQAYLAWVAEGNTAEEWEG